MNKATCLSLLSNAVVVWNTVHMAQIVEQLRAQGETITDDELARISPLAFAHVIPNGTYFAQSTPLARREERNGHFGPLEMKAVDALRLRHRGQESYRKFSV